jgi:hypothetical protein
VTFSDRLMVIRGDLQCVCFLIMEGGSLAFLLISLSFIFGTGDVSEYEQRKTTHRSDHGYSE